MYSIGIMKAVAPDTRPSLNLKVCTSYINSLDGLILYEPVNELNYQRLMRSDLLRDKFSCEFTGTKFPNEYDMMTKYHAVRVEIDGRQCIPVTYVKSVNNPIGRCNPAGALGLFNLRREIRQTLVKDALVDIDIVNCHPVMLLQLVKSHKKNIPHNYLEAYVNDREPFLSHLMTRYACTRDDAKTIVIAYLYGGGFESLKDIENDDGTIAVKNKVPAKSTECKLLEDLRIEMKGIHKAIALANPDVVETAKRIKESKEVKAETVKRMQKKGITVKKKSVNINGTVCSYILQEHECVILEVVYKYCVKRGVIRKGIAALCADGLMVPAALYYDDLPTELGDQVLNATGFDLSFIKKEMENDYCAILDKHMSVPLNEPAPTPLDVYTDQSALIAKHMPVDLDTETGAVLFVKSLVPDKFMWVEKEMYCWTDSKWEKDHHEFIRYLGKEAYAAAMVIRQNILDDRTISPQYAQKGAAHIKDIATSWKRYANFIKAVKTSETYMTRTDVEFNANKDLLGFNNGVYDLIKHEFRPYRHDDFITMTCGYDFVPESGVCPERTDEVNTLLKRIIPNTENLTLLLQLLSAGLTGRVIEYFVMLNGGGRNGKGLIDEFMTLILGDYAMTANVSLLTEVDTTGANPEKALIDKKRLVIMKEPRANVPLNNDRVKDMTGGGSISGRMCYSNKTKIDLHLLLLMECNTRPKFATEPEAAEYERMIDLEFPHRFSTIPAEVDNITVFPADAKYKTDDWKLAHRDAFLHILIRAFKELQTNEYKPAVPQNVRDRTNSYLNMSFPILELFNEYYTFTGEATDVLKMKDVYHTLTHTDTFYNFTKKEKRLYNYKYVNTFFEKHRDTRRYYSSRHYVGNIDVSSVLLGYRPVDSVINTSIAQSGVSTRR